MKRPTAKKLRPPSVREWVAQDRARHLHRVRNVLEREGYPRLQMGLIVALTGAVGFAASFGLLQAGLLSMALRYPLALGLAYLFFLCLIGLWLRTQASDWTDGLDIDIPSDVLGARGDVSAVKSGGGGDFGGGGHSASFDGPSSSGGSNPLTDAWDSVDIGVDADEFAIPLVVIAVLVGAALASLYVVYLAPVLLAEVLVDGAIAYALYRHLQHQERRHWLRGVVRHTVGPFLITAVFLAGMGWAMAHQVPGAHSIGQVIGR